VARILIPAAPTQPWVMPENSVAKPTGSEDNKKARPISLEKTIGVPPKSPILIKTMNPNNKP